MVRKRKIILLLVIAAVALAAGGYWLDQHRHVSLRDAVNPCYWLRRWRAEDLYDPDAHVLYHGNRSLKEVALTIDDGPHAKTSPALLDVLRAHHVRATFFVIGENVKKHPELARRMVAEGHDVGNHTQSHLPLDTLTTRQIRNEIVDCDINFSRITGRRLALLRPPGMRYNKKVMRVARQLGYIVVSDTWGAKDYAKVTPDFIVRGTGRWVENGSIIMLHDDHPATAAALPRIISNLKDEGYRFVTISEMLAHLPRPVIVSQQH
jgi:peptidoglycan/xylan/chitin deacetylase (PgdA/CDA1 family)